MAVTTSGSGGLQPELPSTRALGSRRELARELVALVDDSVLQSVPRDSAREKLEESVDLVLRAVYEVIDTGSSPGGTGSLGLDRTVAALAGQGVSLDAVVDACRSIFRALVHRIGAEAVVASREWNSVMDLYMLVLEEISVSYLNESRAGESDPGPNTGELMRALTDGRVEDVAELARDAGVRLASTYEVVAFSLVPDRPDAQPARDASAGRRRRRVREQLAAFLPSPLASLGPDGGILLIPMFAGERTPDEVMERLRTACRLVIVAVTESAAREDIPAVVRYTSEVLDIVRRLRYPPRVYAAADVAVEYQMLRPGSGRDHLAGIVRKLSEVPDLVETLRALFDQELVRKNTAKRLFIHPNSLDYRLRRIHKLTGYDPSVPSDLRILRYGLVAADFEGG